MKRALQVLLGLVIAGILAVGLLILTALAIVIIDNGGLP